MSNIENIYAFIKEHIDNFEVDGGSGTMPNLPRFDLTPRDYLEFAEIDLSSSNSTHSLVNTVSNLKRAIDCQLDFFLSVFNLDSLYRKKRLGVDKKLGFLSKSGIFNAKSMSKLNTIRNRMEHHYELPTLEDVEVYYDLVLAFISVVENATTLAGYSKQIYYKIDKSGGFDIEFYYEGPRIEIEFSYGETEKKIVCDLGKEDTSLEDIEEFSKFLKVLFLLRKYENHQVSSQYLVKQLK